MSDNSGYKKCRILIIDDSLDIHNDFKAILQKRTNVTSLDELTAEYFGEKILKSSPNKVYELDCVFQGKDGVEKARLALSEDKPYMLAFVDMRMPPGWDGLETVENLWEVDPNLQIVICSAYSDYSWEEIFKRVGETDKLLILKKPFDTIEVAQLASALTEKWVMTRQASFKLNEIELMIEGRTSELAKANKQLHQEISDRLQTEEALQKIEEKYRLLAENVIDTICIIDLSTMKITFVSPSVEKILGYTDKELVSQPIDYALTPEAKTTVMSVLKEEMQRNEDETADPSRSETLELEQIHKNGSKVWTEITATFLRDEEGRPVGILSVTRDISIRKQAERDIHILTQKLIKAQEDERQRISRELHDRVAQDLSISKIGCDLLLDNVPLLAPEVNQKVLEISNSLNSTILAVRDLAYDLRPPGLDDLGLVETVYQYCEDFSEKSGIEVDFHFAGMDNVRLDLEAETNIFRLIQECLNNVWKHADASHATIRLMGAFPNVILRIKDNGKGFNVNQRSVDAEEEKRMGLRSMKERAGLLQGELSIRSKQHEGTIITVKFPSPMGEEDTS